ncbi:MAG: hypothetical protein MGF17_13065 [Trichodesmium sp. MAG_R04]|nr:hypothetical protein [Trichodesmium sp. MAG_R04]
MEWLVLIGLVVIAFTVIGIFFYRRSRFPPSPPNTNSRTSTSNLNRRSYPESSGIQWRDINVPQQTNQIGWVEIDVNTTRSINKPETVIDENFFNQNVPDDLNNILTTVIGSKDPLTQDIFSPGETVYFCRRCRLAYHEDSWIEMERKCRDCSNAHIRQYTLPFPLEWNNIIRNRIDQ